MNFSHCWAPAAAESPRHSTSSQAGVAYFRKDFLWRQGCDGPAPRKAGHWSGVSELCLYPHLTVEQNIAFPLVNHKEGKEEIRRRTLEMARLVQIEDLLKRKPGQLSGGQQQRVALHGRWSSGLISSCWTNPFQSGRPPAIGDAGRDSPHPD